MPEDKNWAVLAYKMDELNENVKQIHKDIKELGKLVNSHDKSVDLIYQDLQENVKPRLDKSEKKLNNLEEKVTENRTWIDKKVIGGGAGAGTLAFGILEVIRRFFL